MLCFFGWFVRNPLPAFFSGHIVWLKSPPSKRYILYDSAGVRASCRRHRYLGAAGYNYAAFNAHLPLKPLLSD